MTRVRRLVWWGGGTVVAVVALVAAGEGAGWPFLRVPLQDMATRATGVPVKMDGGFRTRLLWRPRLEVGHLTIGPAAQVPVPHLLDAEAVEVVWRWRDIWHWRRGGLLRVQRLTAGALDAHLVRGEDGRASWQLGPPAEQRQRPEGEAESPLGGMPRFGTLQVGRGHIVVDDRPLQTQLTVDLRGGEGDDADAATAGYQASVSGRWRALPLKLQVRTGAALPLVQDDEGGESPLVAVRVEGDVGPARLLFEGSAGALLGDRQLQGALRFRGPSLAKVGEPMGLTLPQTEPFDLAGEIGHAAGVWRLRADRAAVGRSLLNGDFRFDTRPRPAKLAGRLGGPRLLLADLAPAVGAAAPGARPAPQAASGRVLPQRRFDLPSLRAMDADVQVAIDELDFGSTAIAPLRGLSTHVLLQSGVLKLQDLKATVAGGQFAGESSLDSTAEPARWAADLRFSGIDIAGWLRGVRSPTGKAQAPASTDAKALKQQRRAAREGGDQPVNAYLTGTLGGTFKATGQGRSTAEILSSLDGTAHLVLRDGTMSHLVTELAGIDIAQALGVLVRSDNPLPLRCARVDLQVHNGVATPRLAVIDNQDSTIRIGGQIDLRNEQLALRAVTKPKDFSVMALRAPVTVGGTLGAPQIGIEGKKVAGKLLGAVVLGAAVAPAAALLALMDRGSDDDKDPCVEQAKAAPPGASHPRAGGGR